LDGKISSILGKHHKDYVATFNEFMTTVKKDLREKIDSLEIIDTEKKKSDDVENLKTERNFFREEAIRLNNMCKVLAEANQDLIRDNKYKAIEIKHLMKKWKESEEANRQLLSELEKNLKSIKILEANKNHIQSKQTNNNFKSNRSFLYV
jgi:isopenicillin N synthase-like dioxygenase